MLACLCASLCMTCYSDKQWWATGEWCEKTTESSPAHQFFIPAIQTLSTGFQPPPPSFPSLGKEDTAERIQSNQWTSGTLHEPVLWRQFPQSLADLRLSGFILCRDNTHQLPWCTWACSTETLMIFHAGWCNYTAWWGEVECGGITQIIRHTGNVSTEAEQGMHCCGQSAVLGSVWASLSWTHYLYQFVLTIGTEVSRQCFRRQITQKKNSCPLY